MLGIWRGRIMYQRATEGSRSFGTEPQHPERKDEKGGEARFSGILGWDEACGS